MKVDGETADLFLDYQFGIKAKQELGLFQKESKYEIGLPLGSTMLDDDATLYKGELALDMYAPLHAPGCGEELQAKPSTWMQSPTPVRSTLCRPSRNSLSTIHRQQPADIKD